MHHAVKVQPPGSFERSDLRQRGARVRAWLWLAICVVAVVGLLVSAWTGRRVYELLLALALAGPGVRTGRRLLRHRKGVVEVQHAVLEQPRYRLREKSVALTAARWTIVGFAVAVGLVGLGLAVAGDAFGAALLGAAGVSIGLVVFIGTQAGPPRR